MKYYNTPILFVFSFILNLSVGAQPALKLRTFTIADGLPSNNITMFQSDSNGMMWIATWNGLCNYDGYRFNSFVAPMGAGQVLTSNRLRFMVPDCNGDVWLSTFDNHLYLLSSKEGRYIDYQERLAEMNMKDFEVSFMHSLSNGVVWIFGKNGMNIRVPAPKESNGSDTQLPEIVPTSTRLPDICRTVRLTPDGNEWLVGEHSMLRYGGKKDIEVKGQDVYCTAQGVVIVGDRMWRYNIEREELREIPIPQEMKAIDNSVQLSDGTIVVSTENGIYATDGTRFRKLSDFRTDNFFKDSKDRLWSAFPDGTALMIDVKRNAVKRLACSMPEGWPQLTVDRNPIHEDMDGHVWILLPGKTLCYFDEAEGTLVPMNGNAWGKDFYPEMQLAKLTTDAQKNLWFSCAHSACMLSFCNYSFRYVPIVQGEETRSVFSDRYGRFWAGTRQGHIVLLDGEGNKLGYLSSNGGISSAPVRFCNKGIYSIFEDSSRRIWIGTRGGGFYTATLCPPGQGGITNVVHHDSEENNVCGDDYFDINEDAQGRIWFATYTTGLMYYENGEFHSARNCKELALPEGDIKKIRRIETATDGTLLFSTADGLLTASPKFARQENLKIFMSRFKANDTTSLMARDVLQTLVCRKSKRIYVATMGGGIQTVASDNLQQDSLLFSQSDNASAGMGNVMAMLEDANGTVWIVGENSMRSHAVDGSVRRVYSSNDWGMDVEFCEAKPSYNAKTKSIIVGAFGGVIIFSPDNIRQTTFKPSIVFSGILYQGNEGITPLLGNHEIELPVDRHNAMVYFSALDYKDNIKIRYAYRIKELDNEWSYVGSEHCAPLSNMPPGHFTLEVRSTDSDGTWIDNNAELKIYVVPTFWQTPWAWLLYILLFGVLFFGVIYLFQLRNAHRMEKEINERQLRFFTDISHQLRTPLTLIGGPVSEVLNTETLTEKAKNYLRFVVNNSNKMLELVNKTLDLKKLQEYAATVEASSPQEVLADEPAQSQPQEVLADESAQSQPLSDDLTILVVEDNDELRYFLATTLSAHYNIIEAENGKVGLKLAAERQPDFIITDIMMPVMDGITMIRQIKADDNICHIPIIILSARTADVYRIEGLKEGADDYITKPFSVSYLQVRVESIVRQRRLLQESWRKNLIADNSAADAANAERADAARTETESHDGGGSAPAPLGPSDLRFTEALTKYVNSNIGNENMKIDDIAHALSISRSVLYSKVKSIYGLSPNDMVRNIRIAQAAKMLREDFTLTVSEIAYAVGFSEPKYFARCFKQSMGKTPTEFRKSEKE